MFPPSPPIEWWAEKSRWGGPAGSPGAKTAVSPGRTNTNPSIHQSINPLKLARLVFRKAFGDGNLRRQGLTVVRRGDMEKNAAVAGCVRPAPFDVQLVIAIRLPRAGFNSVRRFRPSWVLKFPARPVHLRLGHKSAWFHSASRLELLRLD